MSIIGAGSRMALSRLFGFIRPYLWHELGVTLLILVHLTSNLITSWYLGRALDAGINGDLRSFGWACLVLLAAMAVAELAFYLRYRTAHGTAERVSYDIRGAAVDRLSRSTVADMEKKHSGDYVSRLSSDMTLVRNMLAVDMVMAFRGAVTFVVTLVFMLRISWKITLLSMTVGPIITAVASRLGEPMRQHTEAVQKHAAEINSLAQDAVGGIVITKAFGLRKQLTQRFGISTNRMADSGVDLAASQGVMNGTVGLLSMLPFFILFGVGGYETVSGRLTLGDLIIILNMMNNLTWPLQSMGQYLAKIKAGLSAASRVFELLDMTEERGDGENLTSGRQTEYALEMNDLCFGYSADRPVFDHLTLRIRSGETVAIVGPSGTGKSTLLSLLLGLRQPQSGVIRIYGQPMHELSLRSIRQLMTYVPQDPSLFPVTIAENISFGCKEAVSVDELRTAAGKAFADEFISALPKGYNTLLGEQGIGLSGGQRQRISLARAVLKDAPILLLDEATSALDTESEARVQTAIEALRQGRTTIIVAHRLSTIQSADRIIVIDGGKVVQEGRHDDLVNDRGLYASLYREQNGGARSVLAAGR